MEMDHAMPQCSRKHVVQAPTRVDIAVFNGFALPEVAALVEIFQKANALAAARTPHQPCYTVSLLSAPGGRIASSSSVFVWTERVDSHRYEDGKRALFIAGGTGTRQACRDKCLNDWLSREHALSEIVHPIAEGRLLLDAAGLSNRYGRLLDASHQSRAPYPPRPASNAPDTVQTALLIVEQDLGAELARKVSGALAPQRIRSSSSLAAGTNPRVSKQIMASARWLEENAGRPIRIGDAAEFAVMSERNFLRKFQNEIGMTPSDYLMRARLNLSCRMLVESSLPVDKIARHCGFGGGAQLAKLFQKCLSITPTEFRSRNEMFDGVS